MIGRVGQSDRYGKDGKELIAQREHMVAIMERERERGLCRVLRLNWVVSGRDNRVGCRIGRLGSVGSGDGRGAGSEQHLSTVASMGESSQRINVQFGGTVGEATVYHMPFGIKHTGPTALATYFTVTEPLPTSPAAAIQPAGVSRTHHCHHHKPRKGEKEKRGWGERVREREIMLDGVVGGCGYTHCWGSWWSMIVVVCV